MPVSYAHIKNVGALLASVTVFFIAGSGNIIVPTLIGTLYNQL